MSLITRTQRVSGVTSKELVQLVSKKLVDLHPQIPELVLKLDTMDDKDLYRVFQRISEEPAPPLALSLPLIAAIIPKISKFHSDQTLAILQFAVSVRADLPETAKFPLLAEAARVLEQRSPFMAPADLTQVAKIYAKAEIADGALLASFATAATMAVGAFKPKQLVELLVCLEKLKFRSDLLLDRATGPVSRALKDFHVKDVCKVVRIFGTSEIPEFFAINLAKRLNTFTVKTVAQALSVRGVGEILVAVGNLKLRWRHTRKFVDEISVHPELWLGRGAGRLLEASTLEISDPEIFGTLLDSATRREIFPSDAACAVSAIARRFRSPLRFEKISAHTEAVLTEKLGSLISRASETEDQQVLAGVALALAEYPPDVLKMHAEEISALVDKIFWQGPEVRFAVDLLTGREVEESQIADFFVKQEGQVVMSDCTFTRAISGERVPTLIGEAIRRRFGEAAVDAKIVRSTKSIEA